MIIGLDFDNTIIDYSKIFAAVAKDYDIRLQNGVPPKNQVKSQLLKKREGNLVWTKLQGEVYGERISEARCYQGIKTFLRDQSTQGNQFVIISHKSIFPVLGTDTNLHEAAREFLIKTGILFDDSINLSSTDCFFEQTLECKISRIISCQCDVFIDDLGSVLEHKRFPAFCSKFHFTPSNQKPHNDKQITASNSWRIISQKISSLEPSNEKAKEGVKETNLNFDLNSFFKANKLGTISSKKKLKGGINGNLLKVNSREGKSYCVKSYKDDLKNPSRFEKEIRFIELISPLMPGFTPKIIASAPRNRVAVLNFVKGDLVANLKKCSDEIWRLFNRFILELQEHKSNISGRLFKATDSALSLSQHQGILQKRRDAWLLRIRSGLPKEIIELASEYLLEPYEKISRKLLSSPLFFDALCEQDLIVSPSDFGAHNAIINKGKIVFIDFEYAGLDDPAKLVSDYYCHPQNKVSSSIVKELVNDLMDGFDNGQKITFINRLKVVFEIIKIKWCYIIMNPLVCHGEYKEYKLLKIKLKTLMSKEIDKVIS